MSKKDKLLIEFQKAKNTIHYITTELLKMNICSICGEHYCTTHKESSLVQHNDELYCIYSNQKKEKKNEKARIYLQNTLLNRFAKPVNGTTVQL